MTLMKYLEMRNETQIHFADRSGVPRSSINRICLGLDAGGRQWAKIMVATRGRVRPDTHFGRAA